MEGQKYCPKCNLFKDLNLFYKNKRNKDGLCSYCASCDRNSQKEYIRKGITKVTSKKRKEKRIEENGCIRCKNENYPGSKYCIRCFVYALVRHWKLTKEHQNQIIPLLIEKLIKSEFTCFYTGIKIIPGFSASIDHRIPKSKGGTHNIENLEWVHFGINRMKMNLTEIEFLQSSEKALIEINYQASKGVI